MSHDLQSLVADCGVMRDAPGKRHLKRKAPSPIRSTAVCTYAAWLGLQLCASLTSSACLLACREYFQLSEILDPVAFKVFIAGSNTTRRRWYRLHKSVIELSLYIKCHVLLVDHETGRT